MNYKNLSLALGLASLASGVASAQTPPVVAIENRLTFALTFEYQTPGLDPKDNSGKKELGPKTTYEFWTIDKSNPTKGITDTTTYHERKQDGVKVKYGNKEFIQDLVDQGVITTINGYYISMFSNGQGQPYAIYLRNADTTITPIRLDNTRIFFDTATAAQTIERYSVKTQVHVYASVPDPTKNHTTYTSTGERSATSQHTFSIITSKFPTPPTGLLRLETKAKANNTANDPPTWVVSSIKSAGLILSGSRSVINQLGATITVNILMDGTVSGASGTSYDADNADTKRPSLPTGIATS